MDQIPNNGSALAGNSGAPGQQNSGPSLENNSSKFKGFQEFQEKLFQLDMQYPNGLPYEPTTYCALPDTHLNIDNLIEEDKEKKERANFFVCPICAMVVKDPKECNSCQSVFCTACIEPWQQNNQSCPKKCKGNQAVQFSNMHRYVKLDLLGLKFKCSMPECNFVGGYDQAMQHFSECEHQFLQCPLGCGLGIVGRDMDYHQMKQCKYFCITCEICEEQIYPNDPERGGQGIDGHDCVQVLKANLKAAREEISRLTGGGVSQLAGGQFGSGQIGGGQIGGGQIGGGQIGGDQIGGGHIGGGQIGGLISGLIGVGQIGGPRSVVAFNGGAVGQIGGPRSVVAFNGGAVGQGQEIVVNCPHGCVMEKRRGRPLSYSGTTSCDGCRQLNLEKLDYFYHCSRHSKDKCKVCALKDAGVFRVNNQGMVQMRGHGCPMRYIANGDRHEGAHNCDGPQILGPNQQCQSQSQFNLTYKNQQYIYCDSCNIDVCVCCAEKMCRM